MHDLHVIDKVTKVLRIKHFHDNENSLWKKYIIDKLGMGNTNIFFRSNFSEYMIPNYSKLPLFYREVISNWKIVQYQNTSTLEEIKSQFVWYNLGMGWYEKYVHREVANAKPYRFWNSAF